MSIAQLLLTNLNIFYINVSHTTMWIVYSCFSVKWNCENVNIIVNIL